MSGPSDVKIPSGSHWFPPVEELALMVLRARPSNLYGYLADYFPESEDMAAIGPDDLFDPMACYILAQMTSLKEAPIPPEVEAASDPSILKLPLEAIRSYRSSILEPACGTSEASLNNNFPMASGGGSKTYVCARTQVLSKVLVRAVEYGQSIKLSGTNILTSPPSAVTSASQGDSFETLWLGNQDSAASMGQQSSVSAGTRPSGEVRQKKSPLVVAKGSPLAIAKKSPLVVAKGSPLVAAKGSAGVVPKGSAPFGGKSSAGTNSKTSGGERKWTMALKASVPIGVKSSKSGGKSSVGESKEAVESKAETLGGKKSASGESRATAVKDKESEKPCESHNVIGEGNEEAAAADGTSRDKDLETQIQRLIWQINSIQNVTTVAPISIVSLRPSSNDIEETLSIATVRPSAKEVKETVSIASVHGSAKDIKETVSSASVGPSAKDIKETVSSASVRSSAKDVKETVSSASVGPSAKDIKETVSSASVRSSAKDVKETVSIVPTRGSAFGITEADSFQHLPFEDDSSVENEIITKGRLGQRNSQRWQRIMGDARVEEQGIMQENAIEYDMTSTSESELDNFEEKVNSVTGDKPRPKVYTPRSAQRMFNPPSSTFPLRIGMQRDQGVTERGLEQGQVIESDSDTVDDTDTPPQVEEVNDLRIEPAQQLIEINPQRPATSSAEMHRGESSSSHLNPPAQGANEVGQEGAQGVSGRHAAVSKPNSQSIFRYCYSYPVLQNRLRGRRIIATAKARQEPTKTWVIPPPVPLFHDFFPNYENYFRRQMDIFVHMFIGDIQTFDSPAHGVILISVAFLFVYIAVMLCRNVLSLD